MIWNATMELRWKGKVVYDPTLDCYIRILEQKWVSLKGEEEWREIPIESL